MRRPGVRIPLPPVFARVANESEDCRAEALAKADLLVLWLQARRATTRQAQSMAKFAYVYILQSEMDSGQFYTGLTDNLPMRLKAHNSGRVLHTKKWRPWRLKTYIAFSNRSDAARFERYLKSASGRAFVKKHL